MHDILIRGGLLFDGTGCAGVPADLAIKDGRIAAIGPQLDEPATKTIDASGLAVAPGFIDIKTHSDFTLPINPKAESKVRQGVTTEIIGHCGFSVAPVLAGKVELLREYLNPSAPWTPFRELTFPEYLDTFPKTSVNAGMLVGHNTLRLMVMGMADRAPTKPELDAMIELLEQGLRAGALGMSSGLFTPPGSYAQADEMEAFGHVLKRHNAGYFTHLRDEANNVLDAVQEAIAMRLRRARRDRSFQMLGHEQLGQGRNRAADDRRRQGAARRRLRRLSVCRRLQPAEEPAAAMGAGRRRAGDAGAAQAARDARRIPRRHRARRLEQLGPHPVLGLRADLDLAEPAAACRPHHRRARSRARPISDPVDTLCDSRLDQGATRVLVTSISEDDIERIVASPSALIGSDGNCVAPYGTVGKGMPHPRFYGTFPRIIHHYVRERGALPLELAIHKMTGATRVRSSFRTAAC